MTTTAEIADQLNSLARQLTRARKELKKGQVADLSAMQEAVAGHCRAIEALPADQRLDLEPQMISLVEELDCLSEAMRAGLAELAGALSETSQRRRALHAYGKKA